MACQWRIKHKLMLGLGLVVGILALLLTGTLRGLASYRNTMHSIDSKLTELHEVQALRAALKSGPDAGRDPADEPAVLRRKVTLAREALARYEERLQETIERQRDSDQGFMERQLVEALHKWFDQLDQAITLAISSGQEFRNDVAAAARRRRHQEGAESSWSAPPISSTRRSTATCIAASPPASPITSISLIIVLATCVGGVLLMALLLAFLLSLDLLSDPRPARRRRPGGPGAIRSADRRRQRRRDGGPGRGLQRHDRPAARDVRRPGPPGQRAQPAAGPLASGWPASASWPPASPTRSTTRWPASPSAARRWKRRLARSARRTRSTGAPTNARSSPST